MKTKLFALLPVALLTLASIGCGSSGPAMSQVSGKVTFDGEPVTTGHVIFRANDGKTISAAGPIVDGSFDFESMPGEKTVLITATRPVPGKFDESNPGEKIQITEQFIPENYNSKSELSVVVTEEDGTFDFDLQSS
ncbi:hypothetical protein CA51_45180 [Rosistilla oblonga]|uniref:Carboxypeptidase regulatory-like domain-containing protein n=1 Tax=Rosistilla oblonga TaxID=2527990 RepID=A0A518IVZ2_9BACT|nr:hypothetical protein [Rosistilla oblonga]QDV14610.1 hypothetical protein CA51_45180 [Rosistilla oblonga]QDV57258.1 hypothetical protein Mal33_32620 [Rosistilla oblonga]